MKLSKFSRRGFSMVEVLIASSISAAVLGAILSAMLLFTRSTMRMAHYDTMESQATKALELIARDVRMAQAVSTDAAAGNANARTIRQITLTIPEATTASTKQVTYAFTTANTLTRAEGGVSKVLISDIESNSGKFEAYNLTPALAANDYETNQLKLILTVRPNTSGNYAQVSKRVLSARFVLRNR